MELLGETRVSHRHTFLWGPRHALNTLALMPGFWFGYMLQVWRVGVVADLLSLDWPAVAMRLEDVMKAKSPQAFVWHCQLWGKERKKQKDSTGRTPYTWLICITRCGYYSPGRAWGWRTSG